MNIDNENDVNLMAQHYALAQHQQQNIEQLNQIYNTNNHSYNNNNTNGNINTSTAAATSSTTSATII